MADHDFLHDRIALLHDTPMQRKLRHLAPWPVGCVFLPWPGLTEADARAHFRLMKQLGFTCLKQTMPTPEWPEERTLHLALDEGIIPFWYAEGGYPDITPALLAQLGLPNDLDIDAALAHPTVVAHLHALLRVRIGRKLKAAHVAGDGGEVERKPASWVPGVVGDARGHELHPEALPHFVAWLKTQYGTPEAVAEAWNWRHVGITLPGAPWTTWDQVQAAVPALPAREYRHLRDIMTFRAEQFIRQYVRSAVDATQAIDADEPVRAGGEMGLFLPFASRATDMEGMALEMGRGGSFYPSLHLAWHFEEVDFEVARPVYLMAAIAHDWAKGLWSATWESTGGPQYFSGGKSAFVEETRNVTPGFTVDAGCMTQLLLSYIAAGFRGVGLWAWNHRTAGWEGGEYAILDRNRQPTARAHRVGAIGSACTRLRRELWQANKEPLVGVLVDWDNEAIWAAMAVSGRDKYRNEPIRARVGAGRALIDANVPWEHVTTRNLAAGLGARYRVIYAPAFIAFSARLQDLLEAYVRQGGRLVIDMPGAYYDDFGRVMPTGPGTWFERVFGGVLHELTYSSRLNQRLSIDGVAFDGFTCALTPTRAAVIGRTADGAPAVLEHQLDRGSAVVIAAQLSLNCLKPGHRAEQDLLVRHALGAYRSPYRCHGAIAYRLAAPTADHYILINDGPVTTARLETAWNYRAATDAVTGEAIDLAAPIALEAHSGRWVRAAKG